MTKAARLGLKALVALTSTMRERAVVAYSSDEDEDELPEDLLAPDRLAKSKKRLSEVKTAGNNKPLQLSKPTLRDDMPWDGKWPLSPAPLGPISSCRQS